MNTQQLRDLVQKAYYKQKMASEKSTKTPAVLDFNTQHHELALEGTQRQDSAKPPHRKWNAPPSNRERYSHADTRPKQRYDRWDGPRGRQRSPGRHWDKSGDRSWNQPSSYGNSKGKRQTHPGAVSPRNRRKKSPRFQADRVQTESTQEQETPPHFDSQKLMEMMVKEFFQRKEEDRKWGKKDEPESAWLAVRRNGSDKLNKSAPENSTASPCSQRTVNTLTSDGHETPPENPATELNTNSTPNTPNHSSVQQTPADETPSSWKCCLSHLPFLRRTPDQVWHPKRFLPNSSPSNDQNDALTIAGASHEESWTFHALPPNPTVAAVTRRQHATGEHTPALLHYHTTSVRCWRSPHPHMRIRHYEPWQLTCQNHDNTSSELRKLHSVDYMLHLQDGVHTYVPEPLTAPQLVVPHGQRGSTWTHAHDAPWWVASANRQIQTTDRKRGRIRPTDTDRQPYAPHKHSYCHFRKTYSNHA